MSPSDSSNSFLVSVMSPQFSHKRMYPCTRGRGGEGGRHRCHLLASPGVPGNEDRGGSLSKRWEQSVPHPGPTEVSLGNIWPWCMRQPERQGAIVPWSPTVRTQQIQNGPLRSEENCVSHVGTIFALWCPTGITIVSSCLTQFTAFLC